MAVTGVSRYRFEQMPRSAAREHGLSELRPRCRVALQVAVFIAAAVVLDRFVDRDMLAPLGRAGVQVLFAVIVSSVIVLRSTILSARDGSAQRGGADSESESDQQASVTRRLARRYREARGRTILLVALAILIPIVLDRMRELSGTQPSDPLFLFLCVAAFILCITLLIWANHWRKIARHEGARVRRSRVRRQEPAVFVR